MAFSSFEGVEAAFDVLRSVLGYVYVPETCERSIDSRLQMTMWRTIDLIDWAYRRFFVLIDGFPMSMHGLPSRIPTSGMLLSSQD